MDNKEHKNSTDSEEISIGTVLQGIGWLSLGASVLLSIIGSPCAACGYMMVGGFIVVVIGAGLDTLKSKKKK